MKTRSKPAAVAVEDDWRPHLRWGLLAAAIPLVFCAQKLGLDLWHDEIHTVVFYAARSPAEIVTDYSAPNNHVLYTLLLAPLTRLSLAEPVLRFPSLVFAALALAATYVLGLRLGGRLAAVLATVLLGLNVMFLVHAMQVRGYGLSIALVAVLATLAIGAGTKRPRWRRVAIVLVGAAAIYTVPTNVLFVGALSVVAALLAWRRDDLKHALGEVAAWAGAIALAAACYAPIMTQIRAAAANPPPATIEAIIWLAGRVFAAAGHDAWPLVVLGMVVWPTWLAGRDEHPAPGEVTHARMAWALIGLACLLPFVGCMALRVAPFERNFTPLLPLLAAWVAAPVAGLFEMLARRFENVSADAWRLIVLALAAVVLLPAVLLYPSRLEAVRRQRLAQGGYYNYYAADYRPHEAVEAVASAVADGRGYRTCFAAEDQINLVYYLNLLGIARERPAPANGGDATTFVIVGPRPDKAQLAELCGVSAAQLAAAGPAAVGGADSWIFDGGYYRVLQIDPR